LDFENARKTVAALHLAGVPVLAGTDSNMSPGVPANLAHGISLHEELELLVSCGLSTTEALRAATSLPAQYFGLHDRGVIQPGYRADLILVQDDPTEDIKATRSLQRVWIAGHEFKLPQARGN
jgi:imidazolonepropionase-like amidohydrolase